MGEVSLVLEEVRALRLAFERLQDSVQQGGDRPQAYRLPAAAKQLGFKLTFLKKKIRSGEINSVKSGRVRLVTAKEIDRWLSSNAVTPSERVPKTKRKSEGDKVRDGLRKLRR